MGNTEINCASCKFNRCKIKLHILLLRFFFLNLAEKWLVENYHNQSNCITVHLLFMDNYSLNFDVILNTKFTAIKILLHYTDKIISTEI